MNRNRKGWEDAERWRERKRERERGSEIQGETEEDDRTMIRREKINT
jgi:hypothetical protein